MVWMTVSTAPASEPNEHTAAEMASGMPYRRSRISVITPRVPSEPTNNRVRFVAGGGFPRPPSGLHDASVGQHHGQPQHVLPHRPVAHRVRARGTGCGHPAERRVGARIDGEEQAGVAQVFVELLAPHPGLDAAVEVFGVHLEDVVHPRHVDRDPAVQRLDVPFERRPGPEGDHWDSDAVRTGSRSAPPLRCSRGRRRRREGRVRW